VQPYLAMFCARVRSTLDRPLRDSLGPSESGSSGQAHGDLDSAGVDAPVVHLG
jgi:hypothetical protein